MTPPPAAPPATAPTPAAPTPAAPVVRENLWISLLCNIAIPSLLLTNGAKWLGLDPSTALVVALAFPFAYGVWDMARRRKVNFLSVLGLLSTALSGGIALLAPNPWAVAAKETAIPLLFGAFILGSALVGKPLMAMFLRNDEVLDIPKLDAVLVERGTMAEYQALVRRSTYWLASTMLVSAALNFIVARAIVVTDATGLSGDASILAQGKFNEELGTMLAWSWPVITIPMMVLTAFILWQCFEGIKKLTDQPMENFLRGEAGSPAPKS